MIAISCIGRCGLTEPGALFEKTDYEKLVLVRMHMAEPSQTRDYILPALLRRVSEEEQYPWYEIGYVVLENGEKFTFIDDTFDFSGGVDSGKFEGATDQHGRVWELTLVSGSTPARQH